MKLLLVILTASIFITTKARVNPCRGQFLSKCICSKVYYDRQPQFVVNCTDMQFTNVDMLKDLPHETQVLIFTGNVIPTLPWNIFGDLNNLTSLKTIDMSNNGIREIKGKSYHHVPYVETLILNHNNLTISNSEDQNYHHPRVFSNFINLKSLHLTNAFADNTDAALADDLHDIFVNSELKQLYKLHLEQNEIKSFRDESVFCDLPSLAHLYLGDNYLPSLNFNVRCLRNLTYLDLERNNISRLTTRDLESLDELAAIADRKEPLTVFLQDNKFRCNSDVKELHDWLKTTKVLVKDKEHLSCHLAKYGDKYILNLKNFIESRHAKVSLALNITLGVLVIMLAALTGAYAYLRKDQLRAKLAPVFDAVTRKVQYTTIESQDV